MTARRRRWSVWVLLVAFVVVPLVEIFAIIQTGRLIGPWWTIALLVADSVLGAWLVKREGRNVWRALRTALNQGRMPGRELADGALVLIAGTLMLTPGFVSDVVGILLLLPLTRPIARRALTQVVTRKLLVTGGEDGGPGGRGHPRSGPRGRNPRDPRAPRDPRGPDARRPGPGQGPVVRGEVVDE